MSSNPLKKFQKVHPTSYKPKSSTISNKNGKLHFLLTFSLLYFWVNFLLNKKYGVLAVLNIPKNIFAFFSNLINMFSNC